MFDQLRAEHRYVALHHRLDTPASGLMVLALHRDANAGLAAQFQAHTAQRTYLAVLAGTVRAATWDRPVGGKAAQSTVEGIACRAGLTACRLTPCTGRKHQLRVHAALAGHPICGDRRYGGEVGHRWPRLALHAAELALEHPVSGEAMRWEAPLPADLEPLWAEVVRHRG